MAHPFATLSFLLKRAGSNPPEEDERSKLESGRPTTGRNTKLGRKVEKPQDPKTGGPSGQHDGARHDKKHTNK